MVIIGISGKKQAGKSTLANYLAGYKMVEAGIIEKFDITDKGELLVPTEEGMMGLNLVLNTPEFHAYASEVIYPHVRIYSIADNMKTFLHVFFGIPMEWLYGSEEDKNRQTLLRWEDMPGVVTFDQCRELVELSGGVATDEMMAEFFLSKYGIHVKEKGYMTVRDLLQFFGTEVIRRIYPQAHIDGCIHRIKQDQPEIAIISDVRFKDEVQSIVDNEGVLVRLFRNVTEDDTHTSETELDGYDQYDILVDNQHKGIKETGEYVIDRLAEMRVIKKNDSILP